jgi:mRNA interferase MazF
LKYPTPGEVWLVDLGMAAKVRPCVVMSAPIGENDRALITLVPHTTATRGTQYEAPVATAFMKTGAFDAQGLVTVPVTRANRHLGTLNAAQLSIIDSAVCRWLALPCR